jgi:hypothetical protein
MEGAAVATVAAAAAAAAAVGGEDAAADDDSAGDAVTATVASPVADVPNTGGSLPST